MTGQKYRLYIMEDLNPFNNESAYNVAEKHLHKPTSKQKTNMHSLFFFTKIEIKIKIYGQEKEDI